MIIVLLILAVFAGFVAYLVEVGLGWSILIAMALFAALVWMCSRTLGFSGLL